MKRHLKTHGRKKGAVNKTTQSASNNFTSNTDIVITKIEDGDVSAGMSENSNDDQKEDPENNAASLQFDNDPLDTSRTL